MALGFFYKNSAKNKNSNASSSNRHNAMTIAPSVGRSYLSVDGKVEANDTKKVYVDKRLKVKEIFVKEGDYVERDAILMTFDENARNTLVRNIEKESLNLSRLRRNLEVERRLHQIGGSSLNSVKELEESVRSSEITLEEYNEELEKTVELIRSPVSGTIISLTAEENYSVNTEQPLMEITDLTELKILLEIPEYDVINVKLDQKVDIMPEVYEKKRSFSGQIIDISKISKASSSTSENIVEVEVKPESPIENLVPGFKVSATVYLDAGEEGINIPKSALLEDEGDKSFYVFVVRNNLLEKRQVEVENILQGDDVLIASGIAIGDTILTTPSINLKNGDKVEIETRGRQNRNNGSRGGTPGGMPGGMPGGGGGPRR